MTTSKQPRNPLHGVTLERMLTKLVAFFGWEILAQRVRIRCFTSEPSIASSLKFLRKTPWARAEVESLYAFMLREQADRNGTVRIISARDATRQERRFYEGR